MKERKLKKETKSLLDYLMDVMPELGNGSFRVMLKQKSDPNTSKLYSLWQDSESKISNRKYSRPPNMTEKDIKSLESSGFVEIQGKNMKITNSGVAALRTMILDNDAFALSKKSFSQSFTKTASRQNKRNNWYNRLKDAN